jgi:hypothetical protein
MRPLGMVCLLIAGGLGLSLLLPPAALAAWPDVAGVGVALCAADSNQWNPVVVSDGAGGAIVAWQDFRAGNADIYAQRILADGTAAWTSDGVPLCTAAGDQLGQAITSDGAGGAIVTWEDHRGANGDIYAQRVSAEGVVQWATDGVAIRADTLDLRGPCIATDGAGGAFVSWYVVVPTLYSNGIIYAQRIAGDGTAQWAPGGIMVCSMDYDRWLSGMVPDGQGGAILAWFDRRIAGRLGSDLFVQRINADGTDHWAAGGVLVPFGAVSGVRSMVADGTGGVIMAWEDDGDICAQRISATGARMWLSPGGWSWLIVCSATGSQRYPAALSDGAGGAIIAWQDGRSGPGYDVYAQRISPDGLGPWAANGVALTTAPGNQEYPAIVADGSGGAIVAWGNPHIGAQRVSADGVPQWITDGTLVCTAEGGQYAAAIATDGAGGAIIVWHDYRDDPGDYTNADIYAQRVWADGTTPTLLSLVSADVTDDGVRLVWYMGGGGSTAAVVYRSFGGDAWTPIGEVVADGTGHLRYMDGIDRAAARVGYRLGIVEAGVEAFYGETWVDLPARETAFALDPVRPNPTSGSALTVRFALADAALARLDLLDVAGRRVASREVGSLGGGSHTTNLDGGARLAPGIYVVRLTQGTNQRARRVAVVE